MTVLAEIQDFGIRWQCSDPINYWAIQHQIADLNLSIFLQHFSVRSPRSDSINYWLAIRLLIWLYHCPLENTINKHNRNWALVKCECADLRSGKMRRNTADVMGKIRMWKCRYATNELTPIAYLHLQSLHFCSNIPLLCCLT